MARSHRATLDGVQELDGGQRGPVRRDRLRHRARRAHGPQARRPPGGQLADDVVEAREVVAGGDGSSELLQLVRVQRVTERALVLERSDGGRAAVHLALQDATDAVARSALRGGFA